MSRRPAQTWMAPFDFAPLARRYAQDERVGGHFRSL